MLGTREYTLCSPFRANAHNSSYLETRHLLDMLAYKLCKLYLFSTLIRSHVTESGRTITLQISDTNICLVIENK